MHAEHVFIPQAQELETTHRVATNPSLMARLGKIVGASLLVAGTTLASFTAEETINPGIAAAYDSNTGDYPWADAEKVPKPPATDNITWGYKNKATCDAKSSDFDCRTYREGEYYVYDQWGYYLRNCTSYMAWRLAAEFGADASGLGNATTWDNGAAGKGWAVDNTPEIGDIAHFEGNDESPNTSPGHIALVVGVNSDGSATVEEYNRGLDGKFGRRANIRASHYIDVNGPNPEGFTLKVGDTASTPAPTPGPLPSFRPAVVQRATTGETDVAVVGPGNSLVYYFNAVGSPTWGRMTIPGPGAFSSPEMIQRENGETDIVVQGPNNSLDYYFNPPGSLEWHRIPIAYAGAAFSDPAVVQRSSGETDVLVRGPNNSLDLYINDQRSPLWARITVPGAQAHGTPDAVLRSGGELDVAVQGPGNSMDFYYKAQGPGEWGRSGVAAPGWALSAPAMVQRPTGETDIAVQGPNRSLDFYMNSPGSGGWGRMNVAGANTTDVAPSAPVMVQRSTGETNIAVRRPGDWTDFYYNAWGSGSWGSVPVAVGGHSLRAPVMVQRPTTGETDVVVIGPDGRLDFYMNSPGSPYFGVLPIAPARSAS